MADDNEFDMKLLLELGEHYKKIFAKIMHDRGMIDNDGNFNMADFAYVMMHMSKSYDAFDIAMEVWFDNTVKEYTDTDGMTAQ